MWCFRQLLVSVVIRAAGETILLTRKTGIGIHLFFFLGSKEGLKHFFQTWRT